MRRVRRRWPWIIAIAILGVLVVCGTVLLPPVQRRIVSRAFPAGPGTSLEFEELRVGLRTALVRGLRLDWHGLKVSLGEAELRYRPSALVLSRTVQVERLHVRDLLVDARAAARAEPSEPAAPAGEPFRFEGLRPLAALPVRASLSGVAIDAELLAPAPNGRTARIRAVVTGRGIAPGSTGELNAEVGLSLEGTEGVQDVLAGTGSLRIHESDSGVLDVLEFRGDVHPADPAARSGAGLAARLSADLTARDEAYRIAFSSTGTAAREVLGVTASRRDSDGRVAGSWTARLDTGQVNPYLGKLAPPEFALEGTGTFELDPVARSAATRSRFEASASRWERLHPELERIGGLRFEVEAAADYAPPRVEVRSLAARVAPAGAPPVLEIGADQPFRLDVRARTIEPARWGEPLAHLTLDGVPVTWWSGSGSGIGPFAGSVRGSLGLTLDDPARVRLRSTAPLEAVGVRLHTRAGRDLGPIQARAAIDAEMTPERFSAALRGCRVVLADTSTLAFDGSFAMPRNERLSAALEGGLRVHSAQLSGLVPEIDTLDARGHFRLDLGAATLSLLDAALSVNGSGGRALAEGAVTTVRPLVVDLHRLAPRWTDFEPASLRLRVDGFPVAWASRFLPRMRLGSGTLHGEFRAAVPPDRSVHIAGDAPFEVRDADLYWGDLQVLDGARLQVSPSIVLRREAVEVQLDPIAYRDKPGNRFDASVRVRSAVARGGEARFHAQLRAFAPSLTNRIGNLGEFELRAEGTFDDAAKALRLEAAAFDCKDIEGRTYLKGTSVQPFRVALAPFAITPTAESPDLFRATFVPLAIEQLFPDALGFRLTGPLPSGQAVISAHEGGLLFHAPAALEFGPVSVIRNDAPFLDRVHFSFLPEVTYTTTGVRSRQTRIEISSGGRPIARIETHGTFDIAGVKPEREFETTLHASLPALFDQPVVRGLPRFDAGTLDASWRVGLGGSRQVDFGLALNGVVRRDGLVAPDLEARARVEEQADGTIRVEAPLRLGAAERKSDLRASGRLLTEQGQRHLELSLESDRIVVEDLARLATVFLPPDAEGAGQVPGPDVGAGLGQSLLTRFGTTDGRPPWDALHGRVPVHFRSVEFDRYALTDLRATLESTGTKLAVEQIGARFLGAKVGGRAALTFDASGGPRYGVEAHAEVADADLARIFTEVDPARKATLEGRFRLDAEIRGFGPDPFLALLESSAELRGDGRDAVFRGFVPQAKTASRLVRAAGALTFSKELRATGRLLGTLQELHVGEASLRLHRDPSRGLVLDAFDLRSDQLAVHGTGSVRRERATPLVERELRLEVSLAAAGDAAIVFRGLGLLDGTPGTGDFLPVSRTISVGGTVAAPDASDLWETLDDAADHAKGSFGFALRKAMQRVAPGEAR